MNKKYYFLVTVKSSYCDYLRQFDEKVSYNSNNKDKRPFVGILLEIKNIKYFAPLSSPKPKYLKMKNKIDFYKIKEGKLGAINFNNMIPIPETEYIYIDINAPCLSKKEKQYYALLAEQLRWLNRDGNSLREKAKKLYNYRINNKLPFNIKKRCCDFKLLEEKCNEYSKEKNN